MRSQFLAQSGDLFFGHRTPVISPLLSLISQDVGDLLVTQALPWLHDRAAELLSLHRDRALQALHHDHGSARGSAVGNFRTGQRRVTLALRSEPVCLVADLTICREDFFASLGGGKLRGLLLTTAWTGRLLCCRNAARVQTIAAKSSRIAPEIRAAEEKRERVNSNQPQRARYKQHAR